jgi:transcriptional regulator with XRE-family HTH domain
MNNLTPFGITCRKLRLDKGLRLMDVAQKIKRSSAFISAIETGRKPIPDAYMLMLTRAMDLTPTEVKELRRAADRTRKEVLVEKLPEDQRELVAAFARRLDDVPSKIMAELKKIVLKSEGEEAPFHRSRRGIVVPPLSTNIIRNFSDQVRDVFVDADTIEFPIMDVLEFRMSVIFEGFYLDPRDAAFMGKDEGRVIAGTNCIALREDIYEGAWNGNRRDRFTACHELGHFLMHRAVTMARTRGDDDKIFCDSEWQADTFAGTLLMSPRHLPLFANAEDAAKECKMTSHAAEVMWSKYTAEGKISPNNQPKLF